MLFFKRKKNDKSVNKIEALFKKKTTEELLGTLDVVVHLSALYGRTEEATRIIQTIIREIRLRPDCKERLFEKLRDLCLDGFLDHIYVLLELFLREVETESIPVIKEKLKNRNLRNWINYTYSEKLNPEIIAMISEKDIDKIETFLVAICVR